MGFEQKVLTDVTNARAAAVAAGAQGPAQQAPGRERPDRHPALAVRGRRELPRAQGEPERPRAPGAADHDREPDRVQPPALQRERPRLQHRDPGLPGGPARRHVRLHEARLLRRRARGRRRPERRPEPDASREGPTRRAGAHRPTPRCRTADDLLRPDGGEPAQLVPARPASSSRCSALLGFAIGYAHRGRTSQGAFGVTAIAIAVRDAAGGRARTSRATSSSSRRRARRRSTRRRRRSS